jgi:hypothetical protein
MECTLDKMPADDTFMDVFATHTRNRCQANSSDQVTTVRRDSNERCLSEKMSQYTISIELFCSWLTQCGDIRYHSRDKYWLQSHLELKNFCVKNTRQNQQMVRTQHT